MEIKVFSHVTKTDTLTAAYPEANMDSAMQKLKDFTLEGMADKIECPILIVHGEHDTIVPVEIARAPPTAAPPKPAEATPPFSSNIKWDWQLPGPGNLAQARKKVV